MIKIRHLGQDVNKTTSLAEAAETIWNSGRGSSQAFYYGLLRVWPSQAHKGVVRFKVGHIVYEARAYSEVERALKTNKKACLEVARTPIYEV